MGVRRTWLWVWGEHGYGCEGNKAVGERGTWVWGEHGYGCEGNKAVDERGTWLWVWGEQGYWWEGNKAVGLRRIWVWGEHGYGCEGNMGVGGTRLLEWAETRLWVWGEHGYGCERKQGYGFEGNMAMGVSGNEAMGVSGNKAMGVRGTWLLEWWSQAIPSQHPCEMVRTAIVHNYIGWQRTISRVSTHYLLTQRWVNLRVLAEGTLDIDANGNARLTAVSLTQQARGETRCGQTTGRQWRRTASAQRSLNTPCWLQTQDVRFWLADVPTMDSHTSWTPTDSPLTDPVFAVDLLIVSSLVPMSKLMHCRSSPLWLWK